MGPEDLITKAQYPVGLSWTADFVPGGWTMKRATFVGGYITIYNMSIIWMNPGLIT